MLCLYATNWGVPNQLMAKQDLEHESRAPLLHELVDFCLHLNLFGQTHVGLAAILAAESSAFVRALS